MAWETVIFGPLEVLELAENWASCGLLGDVLLVDSAPCTALEFRVEDLVATRTSSPGSVQLLEALAEHQGDVRVRLVWCRLDADSSEQVTAMQGVLVGLRRYAGTVQYDTYDLVAAQSALTALPRSSVDWKTLIVGTNGAQTPGSHAEDNSGPIEGLLYAAAVVGGVLGGRVEVLPALVGRNLATQGIDLFSGVVLGRVELLNGLDRFVLEELPAATAADIAPNEFFVDETGDLARQSVAFLTGMEDGQLGYRRLGAGRFSFDARPTTTIMGWFGRLRAFAYFLFLHSRPVKWRDILHNEMADQLQTADLGLEIERRDTRPGEVPIPDVHTLDLTLTQDLRHMWGSARHQDGQVPGAEVWEAVSRMGTGLIDGGPLPEDCPTLTQHRRRAVLTPGAVLGPPSARRVTVTGGIDHEPVSEAVSRRAAEQALDRIRSYGALLAPSGQRGSEVTANLAAEAAKRDAELLEQQVDILRKQLDEEPSEDPDTSVLGGARAEILGGALASRLDAERLYSVATGSLGQLIDIGRARFTFKVLVGAGAGAAAVLAGALGLFPQQILGWLASLSVNATPAQAWGAVAVASVLLVSGPVVWFFGRYHAFLERAARQAEARQIIFARALVALDEHLRLVNAQRLIELWTILLRGIFPASVTVPLAGVDVEALSLPRPLQVHRINLPPGQPGEWLRMSASGSPWRGAALQQILERAGEVSNLQSEPGLPRGPLSDLALGIEDAWAQWLEDWTQQARLRLCRRAVAEPGITVGPRRLPLTDFMARLSVPGYVPVRCYGNQERCTDRQHSSITPDVGVCTADVLQAETTCYTGSVVIEPESPVPSEESWTWFRRIGTVCGERLDDGWEWLTASGSRMNAGAGDWRLWDPRRPEDSWSITEAALESSYRRVETGVFERTGLAEARPATDGEVVQSTEGPGRARAGDWVVRLRGAVWVVPGDSFPDRYAAVERTRGARAG